MLKITYYRLLKTNNTYHDKVTTKITLTNQNKIMNDKLHRRKKLLPSEVLIYLNFVQGRRQRGYEGGFGTRHQFVRRHIKDICRAREAIFVLTLEPFSNNWKVFFCSS